jgi:Protein of unknown function (DUF4239)
MPTILGTLLFVLATFLGITLILFFIAQKYLSFFKFENNGYPAIFSFAIGTTFGLTLAFICVSTWQNYNHINSVVSKEATTLTTIYRSLEAFKPEFRDSSAKLLTGYTQKVIEQEWPLMSKGQFDHDAYKEFHQFQISLLNHIPLNNAEMLAQQEELRLISEYYALRLERITSAKSALDHSMMLTLGLGAFIFILYQCLHAMPGIRQHLIMISLLSISIGLIFFLILSYNTPFSGPNAISPEAIRKALALWQIDSVTPLR